MCTVPDEHHAVVEMKRVLKPGGRLILVDHVRSSVTLFYWVQRLLELAPARGERELTPRPITHVRDAGFVIEETDRLRAGMIERLVARKPLPSLQSAVVLQPTDEIHGVVLVEVAVALGDAFAVVQADPAPASLYSLTSNRGLRTVHTIEAPLARHWPGGLGGSLALRRRTRKS